MKKFFLTALNLLPLALVAQSITVSEPVSIREDAAYEIISDGRGNVLLFRDQTTKFEVQGYDSKLEKRWDKEIELDKKAPEIIKVVPNGGDFCVLYMFRQKLNPILKAHRYNPAADLVDSVTIRSFSDKIFPPKFEVAVSENKKVALLWFVEEQKNITVLAFHMGRMKLLWETTFSPADLFLDRDFVQILPDNNGNMHFVLERENRRSKSEEHYLEVFNFSDPDSSEAGGNLRRYMVPMKGKLTFDAKFAFDHVNNILVAGGLYSDDNLARADGYFYLTIPQNDPERQSLTFHPFKDEFVSVLLEKEKAKNKGIPEVTIQEVALRKDGGAILIGELNKRFQRGVVSGGYYTRNGIRPIVDYYYDDIFLISLHPDGEEHWKTILHKKQYSQDDDAAYSSYFLAKTPAALRVIFNDEIKPENTVSEYVINGSGEYDRNAVMNTERKELQLRFRDAVQVAANEFIVPSERRSKLKLVKVTY